jgi:hypothetical protein
MLPCEPARTSKIVDNAKIERAGPLTMTRMRAVILQGAVVVAALGATAARADLENENLLVTAPPGYKVGFRDKKPDMLMTEFVPAKETVENWTEMVTVQVFFGLPSAPQQFMDDMVKRWRAACPDAEDAHTIANAPENGYPTLVWLLSCPKNREPASRKSLGSRPCSATTASTSFRRRSNSSRARSRSRAGWAISEM